ncbi:hypothetical protein LSH36_563g00005 [Paralvinella palmiformis]|uniref:C2H2-type domain-containing protein n=1 Tax=Paralvinella palmiformis TaxID=53620 RepID=A0AAD9J6R6_9ANNE|nr:hypothetical protein LSH36_563g00005 [Paralvinella palmiformis]
MWALQYQPQLSSLLQKALVELCTQHLPWEGRLEIDGIFCVSGKDPSQQIVIKIHKALEKPEPKKGLGRQNKNTPSNAKKLVIEDGKIISMHHKTPPKKSPSMPLNLSLPNLKKGVSIITSSGSSLPSTSTPKFSRLQKTLIGSQSLRALLGNKAAAAEQGSVSPNVQNEDQGKPTILKQPQTAWLRNEVEDSHSLDTGSDSGSERHESQDCFKGSQLDIAGSESSGDIDDDTTSMINVTCKICNINFDNFSNLQAHTLQVHKRYACRQCCNTFSLSCNLRRHERLHAGVKPHACKYCKRSFSRTADLRAHLRKHMEDGSSDLISCNKCSKSFRTAVNLRLHMYKVHKEKDCVYTCNICAKVFQDVDEYQQHKDSHTASLMHGGISKDNGSSCSTPLMNGSHDSMDEDEINDGEFNAASKELGYDGNIGEDAYRAAVGTYRLDSPQFLPDGSPSQHGQSMFREVDSTSACGSVQGNEDNQEDIGLYFGSPLVIKEENDSQDSENMKRYSRRKGKPNKVTAQSSLLYMEDDMENLEPVSNNGEVDTCNGNVGRIDKREAGDWICDDITLQDTKRQRMQQESLLDNFNMANQSLEDIMKQVNENLYKNKDVLIAEEKEKEIENKERKNKRKPKIKRMPALKLPSSGVPLLQPKHEGHVGGKPPIVLLVSSSTPKVAIPPAKPLRVSIKKDQNASWCVSHKEKKQNMSFRPILPHNLSLTGNADGQTYNCAQWGCNYTCVGFANFEEHTLSAHGRYPCKFCSQTFTGRNNRTRHIRYHITGKQHQCNECGKFFARPDSLKEHRFIHTKSYRDSVCCNCQVSFEKKATLLSHMKKCFSDEQLDTDKVPVEEIERDKDTKKGLSLLKKEPSDIGVMKAEYLGKEKELSMESYLGNIIEIAPVSEGNEDLSLVTENADQVPMPVLQRAVPAPWTTSSDVPSSADARVDSPSLLPFLHVAPSVSQLTEQQGGFSEEVEPASESVAPSGSEPLQDDTVQENNIGEEGAADLSSSEDVDKALEIDTNDQPLVVNEEEVATVDNGLSEKQGDECAESDSSGVCRVNDDTDTKADG